MRLPDCWRRHFSAARRVFQLSVRGGKELPLLCGRENCAGRGPPRGLACLAMALRVAPAVIMLIYILSALTRVMSEVVVMRDFCFDRVVINAMPCRTTIAQLKKKRAENVQWLYVRKCIRRQPFLSLLEAETEIPDIGENQTFLIVGEGVLKLTIVYFLGSAFWYLEPCLSYSH